MSAGSSPHPPSGTLPGWAYVVAVVVVAAAISGITVWWAYQPGGPLNPRVYLRVDVLQVVWTRQGYPETISPGFNVQAGAPESVSLSLYCANGTGVHGPVPKECALGSAFIDTPGFGLVSTNAPFEWSSGTTGADATVTVNFLTPSDDYSGNLTIELH